MNVPDRLRSLGLRIDGDLVDPHGAIAVCDLSGADGGWADMPDPSGKFAAAIDPELGRIALRQPASQVTVFYCYGFNADMGGGEYPRADSFASKPDQPVVRVPGDFSGIQSALDALAGEGVVEVTDSGLYSEPSGLSVQIKANGHIELRARDGARPTISLGGELAVFGGSESAFDLNGFLITSDVAPASASSALVRVPAAKNGKPNLLSRLAITHCTLIPGWALKAQGDPQFPGQPSFVSEISGPQITVSKSILGPVRAPEIGMLGMADCLVDANQQTAVACAGLDGTGPSAALRLSNCTVIGKVHSTLLSLVSNCIFLAGLSAGDASRAPLWADRKQEGCVRFSYLPAGSITPRHYECLTEAPAGPAPLFWSLRYGDPAYGKLLPETADAVRRGADDGAEMGAFHFLLAPQRETDLRVRMQEYLPVGMEYGIFYET